jgi:hypothetical protein
MQNPPEVDTGAQELFFVKHKRAIRSPFFVGCVWRVGTGLDLSKIRTNQGMSLPRRSRSLISNHDLPD